MAQSEKAQELSNNGAFDEFISKGKVLVDFYADWCGPCKMLAPIMAEMAEKYKGKVDFYKVNTDNEPNLSGYMGIRGIPAVFYFPTKGQPSRTEGLMSKEDLEKAILQLIADSK